MVRARTGRLTRGPARAAWSGACTGRSAMHAAPLSWVGSVAVRSGADAEGGGPGRGATHMDLFGVACFHLADVGGHAVGAAVVGELADLGDQPVQRLGVEASESRDAGQSARRPSHLPARRVRAAG